jgi:hypothetical protein
MKTLIPAVLLSFTLTGLTAQTPPEPKKDLEESIKQYHKVSAELSAEVDRIDKHLRKADSLLLIRIDSFTVALQKLHEITERNKRVIMENERQQIRLKEEYLANMRALGIIPGLD